MTLVILAMTWLSLVLVLEGIFDVPLKRVVCYCFLPSPGFTCLPPRGCDCGAFDASLDRSLSGVTGRWMVRYYQ